MEALRDIYKNQNILPQEIKSSQHNIEEILKEIEDFYFENKKKDEDILPTVVDVIILIYLHTAIRT